MTYYIKTPGGHIISFEHDADYIVKAVSEHEGLTKKVEELQEREAKLVAEHIESLQRWCALKSNEMGLNPLNVKD